MSKNLVPTNVSPELDINLLDLEREIEKEISDNGGITTDGEEEIGFDDEELLELSEIEAELLEEEEEGVNIEAEDEATMQEIRERDFFYEENRETLVRKKLRNQEDDESFSEISTLSLFFKDVANFPFKVDKKSERDLLYLYAYIRGKGGDEWLDGKSSLDIPEHIFGYVFGGVDEKGNDSTAERIEEIIMLSNAKLITSVAKYKSRTGIQIGDLIGDAAMGFVRGLRKYDLEKLNPVSKKPYELSTYVTWWIRQSADIGVESQRKDAKLTVKLVKRIREYYKTFYILKTKLTNEPSVSEIADYLGTPTEYIQAIKDIIENSVPLSLDEPSGGGEGNEGTLMDCIADTSNVFGDIANKDFFDYIMHIANEVLQIRERNILLMRFRIAPYENPGKDIEGVEETLMKFFSQKKVTVGGVEEIRTPRYEYTKKIDKKQVVDGDENASICGIDLKESTSKQALSIPQIIEVLKEFGLHKKDYLRVVEDERDEDKPDRLIAFSVHLDNGKGATLKEIGRELGMSRERVRQIESGATIKLMNYCAANGIDYNGQSCSSVESKKQRSKSDKKEKTERKPSMYDVSFAVDVPYYELPKKTEKRQNLTRVNTIQSIEYQTGLKISTNPGELKVGMSVENLKKKISMKYDKAGKGQPFSTGELIPYRIGTIVEIGPMTIKIKLENGEFATVLKEYIKPLVVG